MCVVFFVFYFSLLYFSCCVKITSLSATAYSDILWNIVGQNPKKTVSMSWPTRIDSLICDFSVFISKLSYCNKVELSTAVLSAFGHFKFFCSTWMVSSYLSYFALYSLKLCCGALIFSISISHSSLIFITSTFFNSIIWRNFSCYSIVYVVPLSLVSFRAMACFSLSLWIFKRSEIFRVPSFGIFCPFVLENWSLGPSHISDPVLHH